MGSSPTPAIISYEEKYYEKQRIILVIQISQAEAQYLREHGCSEDVHVSSITAKSRGKRYYATETRTTLALLKKFNAERVTLVVEPKKKKRSKSK